MNIDELNLLLLDKSDHPVLDREFTNILIQYIQEHYIEDVDSISYYHVRGGSVYCEFVCDGESYDYIISLDNILTIG